MRYSLLLLQVWLATRPHPWLLSREEFDREALE